MPRSIVSISIDSDLAKELSDFAAKENLNTSAWVEKLIRDSLDKKPIQTDNYTIPKKEREALKKEFLSAFFSMYDKGNIKMGKYGLEQSEVGGLNRLNNADKT